MLKALIKPLCPPPMLAAWRRARLAHMRRRNAARSIGGVFEDVYRRNAWGGAPGEWRSGSGSDAEQLGEYATAVADFIREHGIRSVVDLGCGDFRVGAEIASRGVDYTGVDIVPGLIERNARAFGSERIRFVCLDITRDDPPPGELCLVRQVFQHLSNAEITAALPRLSRYRYVLVTEHQPAPGRMRRPNIDKPHGPDTRIIDGSAVCLDAPPFGLPGVTGFHEAPAVIPLVAPGETLRTVLLTGTG